LISTGFVDVRAPVCRVQIAAILFFCYGGYSRVDIEDTPEQGFDVAVDAAIGIGVPCFRGA